MMPQLIGKAKSFVASISSGTMKWDYERCKVRCSMHIVTQKGLKWFNYSTPRRPQYSPHPWTAPQCGKVIQYAHANNSSSNITKEQKKFIDNTILPSLGSISTSLRVRAEDKMVVRLHRYASRCTNRIPRQRHASLGSHWSIVSQWIQRLLPRRRLFLLIW